MVSTKTKTIVVSILVLLFPQAACLAVDDASILAAGNWSAPVAGTAEAGTARGAHRPVLRGRLLLCESPKNHSPALYLEIQDCGEVWGMTEVYCDMRHNGGLRLETRDPSGNPIHESRAFGGGMPGAHWITLPADATIRLRISPYATFTYADKGDYFVAGTFSSQLPKDPNDHRLDVWQGTLKLPALKITPKQP